MTRAHPFLHCLNKPTSWKSFGEARRQLPLRRRRRDPYNGATATFDLFYRGDPLLGLIDDQQTGFTDGLGFESLEFYVIANGVEVLDQTFNSLSVTESFFQDDVINLGSSFGPTIDVTFGYNLVADGAGGFGFDLAVGAPCPNPQPGP